MSGETHIDKRGPTVRPVRHGQHATAMARETRPIVGVGRFTSHRWCQRCGLKPKACRCTR